MKLKNENVYLDYAATTPLDNKVLSSMTPYFKENFGNPASLHKYGKIAKKILEKSREEIKNKLNAKNYKLVFTSGGSESNNFAIKGLAEKNNLKKHIITTKIEHDCILKTCKYLETKNYEITYLNVDKYGFINLEDLKNKIRKDTLLVSIIHANNEIGTIQDIKKIAEICHQQGTLLHSDACQSFCKVDINLEDLKIDLLTINAHKIYGPKGVGALLIKDNINLNPLIFGGGQEFGLRSGTVNIPGVVGFASAINSITKKDLAHIKSLQNKLIKGLLEIEDCWINGPITENKLCNNVNVSFKGAEGEAILLHLDNRGVFVSTGSACSSNTLEANHVLLAIGLKKEDTHGTIRFSLGKETTLEDIDYTIQQTKEVIDLLRKMNPYKYK
jgi:cysteine desulfurase